MCALLLMTAVARAQPADCAARPLVPGNGMSLDFAIPLAGRPGVPAGAAGGYVGFGLRDVPANGTICDAPEPDQSPPISSHDVLAGPPSSDLLMGSPPRGHVYIDVK